MKIIGLNVVLRDRRSDDFETYQHWITPEAAWKQFDAPWEPVSRLSDADLIEWPLRMNFAKTLTPRRGLEIEVDGKHVGMVSWYWIDERTQWADVGIAIWNPDDWSRGLGREAFELWVDYMFSSTNWMRLGLGTWAGNTRMMRLASSLGFTLEATFRKARVVDSEAHDALRYGMLREEWQNTSWIGCSSDRE